MTENIAASIAKLCSANFTERQAGASEIFQHAREVAEKAVAHWLRDADLAPLLGAPEPVITAGIAVTRETFLKIRSIHGGPRLARVPPDQNAQEFELCFPGKVLLDILTTREAGDGGAIARYLEKFGEGVQQVEFLCRNVDQATELLKQKFGVAAVYPATRPGADGTRVNFFLVSSPAGGKILIELYELPDHATPGELPGQ
jgi:hypothetical protein